MRNFISTLALGTVLAIAGATAANAAPVTAEAGAGAKIIAPLEIKNTSSLYFGTVAPSLTQGDKVVVTPAGDKKCGAALTCLTADHTAASFDVKGEADAVYTISLPDGIAITNEKGDAMKVYGFTGSKDSGRLVKGADNFTVGGTLDVGVRQPAGKYTGRFVVAVEYQ
jgi:Domain of unknown function (DUF4402)